MIQKLIQSIPLLLLLTANTMAQDHREPGPSLQERARQLEPLIIESATRYGVDARILRMMCFIESRFRLDAVSPKGARGPMQFMPETAARYGLKDPNDPKQAIDAAARYMRDLLVRFGGRIDLAVAAYNAGEGVVESFRTGRSLVLRTGKIINPRGIVTGGVPPYPATRAYVSAIVGPLRDARPTATSPFPRSRNAKASPSVKGHGLALDTTTNKTSVAPKKKPTVNSYFIEVQ